MERQKFHPMSGDVKHLSKLASFAKLEIDTADVEPWARMIGGIVEKAGLDDEQGLWLTKLYGAYDAFDSAWLAFVRWQTPYDWFQADDWEDAKQYPCTQERRGLRGGRILKHFASYVDVLQGATQRAWLESPLCGDSGDWERLTEMMREVWGCGRQTAFEWAEFAQKANGLNVWATNAQLWESEGPRRSLQKLYGNATPDSEWLDNAAHNCKEYIEKETGIAVSWEDFETIICDFNVMRDGRYYPGRHLAALREEIAACPESDQPLLVDVFQSFVPEEWQHITPGIRKDLLPVFKKTGLMVRKPHTAKAI